MNVSADLKAATGQAGPQISSSPRCRSAPFMMSALPLSLIGILIGAPVLFTLAVDSIKLAVLARLRID